MDFRIELVPLAVSDVDRAVAFYGDQVGWPVDHDRTVHEGLRFVQVTPPGSACSICFGTGLEMLADGQRQMIQVVVEDADEALAYLRERDVAAEGVDDLPWGRFVRFEDPDGNRWALQQLVVPA
ncbi:VOC family protein [Nocardioides panacis]|uniref:VOC family protein n=1 Tax=Nocardioides panacis TaxID=2849501 RepID=A0A975T0P4_9ACTN|nr:VOC family protein [Nocardioides panacis]QWZ09401.1 VOC family protein [Nocardioides panacis]